MKRRTKSIPPEKIACNNCQLDFGVYPSQIARGRRFCSNLCAKEGLSKEAAARNTRKCIECSIEFVAPIQNILHGNGKLCSIKCQNRWQSRTKAGKKPYIMTDATKHKFRLLKLGKPNPSKGIPRPHTRKEKSNSGSNRDKRFLGRLEYKQWRSAVFSRDNYTCQICEQYGGTLHADHIIRWVDSETLRYSVDNGRTLCVPCHYYITFKTKMKPGTQWCNFTAKKAG